MSAQTEPQLLEKFAAFFPQASALGSWVGGELLDGDGTAVPVIDPATGRQCLRYADATAALVDRAAESAVLGQRVWAQLAAARRGSILFDVGHIVRDHLETLAWDKTPPGPHLPAEIIERTRARYAEALQRLAQIVSN